MTQQHSKTQKPTCSLYTLYTKFSNQPVHQSYSGRKYQYFTLPEWGKILRICHVTPRQTIATICRNFHFIMSLNFQYKNKNRKCQLLKMLRLTKNLHN